MHEHELVKNALAKGGSLSTESLSRPMGPALGKSSVNAATPTNGRLRASLGCPSHELTLLRDLLSDVRSASQARCSLSAPQAALLATVPTQACGE